MPRLLDLFCGAGGAAVGYHRAGFDVVGVDCKPQPHYPFAFILADAMTYPLAGFDAIHASPPCQRYSRATPTAARAGHPDLVAATRARLADAGVPYVIENVPGAPMVPNIILCGCMFNLPHLRRERWFEAPALGLVLRPPCHHEGIIYTIAGSGGSTSRMRAQLGRSITRAEAREAMGIDWMSVRELSQAIPPAYTEFVGHLLLEAVCAGAARLR